MATDGNSPDKARQASILPQNIEFTPEIEAALDDEWAQIAEELHGESFGDEDDDEDEGNQQ